MIPRRGDIYIVQFDPARGHEIRKTQPALVIQNDVGNRHSPVTIVAAITSQFTPVPYPIEVTVHPSKANGLSVESAVRLNQIRSLDRERLVKRLGALEPPVRRRVDEAIKISLGLVAL
ncbi:MAG TPA: type II toxin-antitoxin system PemK/MazF family toxin [Bryobacteraceae bacterium]|nr:type II toxin-antitoxin system PemK/MazF family toxin [Bryobacteraceae bacterium]